MPDRTVLKDPSGRSRGSLDVDTGNLYDEDGSLIVQMRPREKDVLALSDYAARYYHANVARQAGAPACFRDADGDLVTMDIGPNDVHTDFAMPNFAGGYKLAPAKADIAMPVVTTPFQSNKFNVWDDVNAFRRVLGLGGASGAQVPEISPTKSQSSYSAKEYALATFVTTETEANADAPLNIKRAAIQRIMNALLLEREIRVANLLQTSGSWNSNNVTTLGATAKWNGGASSDPIADLHTLVEASAMPVTRIIMSERVGHVFSRNSNVQKYTAYKDGARPLPSASEFAALLSLPPIEIAPMKYYASGTTFSYVWGNHVVLVHEPPQNPPTNQEDVATAYTFRFLGGTVPDPMGGQSTAGWTVREYYDPRRGGRGGSVVVVVHNDDEVMTSTLVGGLLLNAYA